MTPAPTAKPLRADRLPSPLVPSPAATPTDPAASPPLSWRVRVAYATGGLLDNFGLGGLKNISNPIFNIVMGVSPALVGLIVALSRLWDAFADPYMGNLSDNARTRWGRRRPFIIVGAITCGLTIPLLFAMPSGLGNSGTFAWLLFASLLFYTAFTLFTVPYYALGYEQTQDYHGRTSLMASRALVGALTVLAIQWVFPLIQSGWLGTPEQSVRIVGVLLGLVFGLTALVPGLFLKERALPVRQRQEPLPLRAALGSTLQNGNFRLLLAIAALCVIGFNLVNSLGIYISIYYVYAGDVAAASVLAGWAGTIYSAAVLLSTPLVTWLAGRTSKRTALIVCQLIGLAASFGKWWLFDPAHPWAQLWVNALLAPSMTGLWIFVDSMVADVCDHDELRTGRRQEALFGSVYAWVRKTGLALSIFLSGFLLTGFGFDAALGGQQPEGTIHALRLAFTWVPAVVIIASIWFIARYPLTQERMAEIRAELAARERAAAPDT